MIQTATGIILRTRPLTETSLIVHWLTANHGRIATVAKGARRPKSQFLGKLDLFYEAEFSFSRSRRSELHTLREAALRETHPALREDMRQLQQASYGAALIEQVTETETPLAAVFELMHTFLAALSRCPPQARNIFAFELKLLHEMGLTPDLARSHLSNGARQLVGALIESDWEAISSLAPSRAQATELRQFLHGFLIFHLGGIPKHRNAAIGS